MGKYYLVGRVYDRTKNEYIDKFILEKINGEKLSTLKKIDGFTSSHSQVEIFNIIKKEYGRDDFSFLSVMYLKDNNSNPYYYNVIMGDKLYNDCVSSADYKIKNIEGVTRNSLFINVNTKLYKDEVSKLLEIIKGNDFEKFERVYPYNNILSSLVWRYMTASYDNELEKEKDLQLILLEFSRYKTFRGWYVEQTKPEYKRASKTSNSVEVKSSGIVKKEEVLSIERNVEEYNKRFLKDKGISYDEYHVGRYNEEYEEFLDADEYSSMNNSEDDDFSNYDTKRLGKRH